MAYHLHKAKLALQEAESELKEAATEQGGGNLDSLTKAQETMRALETDLARALESLGGSSDARTVSSTADSTILTPATSVQGETHPAAPGGPQLTVPVAPGREPRKLTLAQRKELRDTFSNKTSEYNSRFTELLQVPWTVHVDTNNVLSYLPDEETPGHLLASLYDGAISGLEEFLKKSPDADDARAAINRAGNHHVVTVEPYAPNENANCDFNEGKLRLLFKPDNHVWSTGYVLQYLGEALHAAESKAAPTKAGDDVKQLPFLTRYGIKREYDEGMPAIKDIAKAQLGKEITFQPNFVENFTFLKNFEDADKFKDTPLENDWQKNMGDATLRYFQAFADQLAEDKFNRDEMLQEGFLEAVDKETVVMRVVNKKDMKDQNASNELVIEDGYCVLRAHPQEWGSWQRSVARELMNQL